MECVFTIASNDVMSPKKNCFTRPSPVGGKRFELVETVVQKILLWRLEVHTAKEEHTTTRRSTLCRRTDEGLPFQKLDPSIILVPYYDCNRIQGWLLPSSAFVGRKGFTVVCIIRLALSYQWTHSEHLVVRVFYLFLSHQQKSLTFLSSTTQNKHETLSMTSFYIHLIDSWKSRCWVYNLNTFSTFILSKHIAFLQPSSYCIVGEVLLE